MIPLIDMNAVVHALGDRLTARMDAVLAGGKFILGPEVQELEQALTEWCGAAVAIGVACGTDALEIALRLRGIGAGDAVFVPGFTFVATAEAVVRVGATPVFVDIKAGDMTLDAEDLRARVLAVRREGDLRPAAVIPVDIFGVPADYDEIQPVAEEERLIVIGDAAQSFGGALGNRRVGTLSPITTLSFYPTKPLGCFGDGGAVLSTLPEDEAALRELRQHGFDSSRKEVNRLGLNSRLDSLQAAVLLTRLEFFEEELVRRARIARHYANRLAGAVRVPEIADAKSSAWAVYTVRSPRRDRVREHLTERGIATALFYDRPLCDYGPYKPYRALSGELPVCRHACETVVSLPMHPYLSDENVEQVVDAVLAAVE